MTNTLNLSFSVLTPNMLRIDSVLTPSKSVQAPITLYKLCSSSFIIRDNPCIWLGAYTEVIQSLTELVQSSDGGHQEVTRRLLGIRRIIAIFGKFYHLLALNVPFSSLV